MKAMITSLLLVGTTTFLIAQQQLPSTTSECAPATQRALAQKYSLDDQLKLSENPEKLACLNYMYANSYSFPADQMVLNSQKALFDVEKFNPQRAQTITVTVYDEKSGLTVNLFPWEKVNKDLDAIKMHYQIAAAPSK